MFYEWDEQKNKLNFQKHNIWFEQAQSIWSDPNAIEYFDDEHSNHEDRFIRIGRTSEDSLLLVVFCERNGGQIIRIISARSLTKKEKKEYEEGI